MESAGMIEKSKGNLLSGIGSQLAALIGLIAICIVLTILSPHFLTLSNFFNTPGRRQSSPSSPSGKRSSFSLEASIFRWVRWSH